VLPENVGADATKPADMQRWLFKPLEDFMIRWLTVLLVASFATTLAAADPQNGTLESATQALGADHIQSIEYSGTGKWFRFGQEPNPNVLAPEYEVTGYTATIDYNNAAMHVRMASKPVVDPTRWRRVPETVGNVGSEGLAQEFVAGDVAWILGQPGGPGTGLPVAAVPDAGNAEGRGMDIWATPQGFLRAAAANHATSKPINGGGTEVTFMLGKHKVVGRINARNQVYMIHYRIDHPVLGDMLCEAGFYEYRDFGGVMFPSHIVRVQGGKIRLEVNVSEVKANPAVSIPVPPGMREAMTAPVTATAEKLSEGVYWIRGWQYHSVAIDQGDHIVVIDAPLNEARSLAVIAKVKETIPNKPIRYLINTHAHYDHSGGVRTYADEGSTIVTMPMNQEFYEQAWRTPHTLNPDRLEISKKTPKFLPVINGKLVLADSKRPIEIHQQVGTAHCDAMLMVYLPVEKILVEVDSFNTEALTAPRIDSIAGDFVSQFIMNLNENILRLKLDVRTIVPLHGPRTTTMAEMRQALLIE
jgi:glyoxylase-like metal-dependent hydrolase (beta-lactamase superfamily II)